MRKILSIALAIIGFGLVLFSLTRGWTAWLSKYNEAFNQDAAGYSLWQGKATGILALMAFALVLMKSKLSVIPALMAIGAAAFLYFVPPVVAELQHEPQKAIFIAIAGCVLIAIGGLIVKKRA